MLVPIWIQNISMYMAQSMEFVVGGESLVELCAMVGERGGCISWSMPLTGWRSCPLFVIGKP